MTSRLLQNFNGGKALIVTTNRTAVEALEATLAKLGVASEFPAIEEGRVTLDLTGLKAERDILFVDGDLDGTLPMESDADSRCPPVPVIGLVGVEAPSRLKRLINVGATAFLRKPVHSAAVYTALFLGVNQFLLRSGMQSRLDDMERRRRGRRSVIKAVLALMTESGVDDDEAYNRLRRESMRLRVSLEEYCEEFLGRWAATPRVTAPEGPPGQRAGAK
ncbi:ANTAR domain-containing response regulator [Labrys monachus]|uniref:AmiR/NasT family two-component response regulator n=1 Tax=Labrys monachus TaxID=217067 RepID=A0ABU0FI99_9HYPH|nr:ANTAR domain-containing protein [Labrys monachus]MDQ0394343.1 AmiR/NasT family two-component response regulator [Labrys monachus]